MIIDHLEENGSLPKINVLQALKMISAAWQRKVTKETIINCFRKSGISEDSQKQALADSDDPFGDLSDAMEKYSSLSPDAAVGVSSTDFVDFDKDMPDSSDSTLTDAEIVASVTNAEIVDEEEDEEIMIDLSCDDEPPPQPSQATVDAALLTMENYILYAKLDENAVSHARKHLHSLQSLVAAGNIARKRQALITSYGSH